MVRRAGNWKAEEQSGMELHDEFLELCALAGTGELSKEEQRRLAEHLAVCAECRQASREFAAVVEIGVPLLASEFARPWGTAAVRDNQETLDGMPAAVTLEVREPETATSRTSVTSREGSARRAERNPHRQSYFHSRLAWLPFAAGILLTLALGIYAYRLSVDRRLQAARVTTIAADSRVAGLEEQISDAGHEREQLEAQLHERGQAISDLRRQVTEESAALKAVRTAQSSLEESVRSNQTARQQAAEETAELGQKLAAAQSSLENAKSELATASQQRVQDQVRVAGLESEIGELTGQLQGRDRTIERQEAVLAHDGDIRELMGARDLYIAEVYDVGRDGKTEKPFGRVFYTKGKSLVFYAYDLDQQAMEKKAAAFQAWGRRGPDQEQALNLGIFYQDNSAKKRWVLKFDNPKELAEIDAVFVTEEPKGGSPRPSGKPLLFTYLKINANHP